MTLRRIAVVAPAVVLAVACTGAPAQSSSLEVSIDGSAWLVVPGDTRGARRARDVIRLRLVTVAP